MARDIGKRGFSISSREGRGVALNKLHDTHSHKVPVKARFFRVVSVLRSRARRESGKTSA
jgi:hypothetical protein